MASLEITTALTHTCTDNVIHVLRLFGNLTALGLICNRPKMRVTIISPNQLEEIAATCPQLKVLSIHGFDLSQAQTAISRILRTMKYVQVMALKSIRGLLQLDENG